MISLITCSLVTNAQIVEHLLHQHDQPIFPEITQPNNRLDITVKTEGLIIHIKGEIDYSVVGGGVKIIGFITVYENKKQLAQTAIAYQGPLIRGRFKHNIEYSNASEKDKNLVEWILSKANLNDKNNIKLMSDR